MTTDVVFVAITMDSGEPLRVLGFLTRGRGTVLPAGAIWVSGPSSGWWTREPTPENIITEVGRSCPTHGLEGVVLPQPVRWRLVAEADVPTDRTYRDAWADEASTLTHDMGKAREIHRDRLRKVRAGKLAALDTDYQRADEQKNTARKTRIAKEKQVLRDLPADPAIDAAADIEELKATWPLVLIP